MDALNLSGSSESYIMLLGPALDSAVPSPLMIDYSESLPSFRMIEKVQWFVR